MLSSSSLALKSTSRLSLWNASGWVQTVGIKRLSSSKPPTPPPPSLKKPPKHLKQPQQSLPLDNVDPHAMASELIAKNYASRVQGTVAIQNYLTPKQKMQNFAMAGSLFAFVGWVWWYSMNAVGQSADNSLESLASEARMAKMSVSEQQAQELAQLDMGVTDYAEEDGVTVAVAAPDDIAKQEEEQNIAALGKNKSGNQRPLWKRIILFWK